MKLKSPRLRRRRSKRLQNLNLFLPPFSLQRLQSWPFQPPLIIAINNRMVWKSGERRHIAKRRNFTVLFSRKGGEKEGNVSVSLLIFLGMEISLKIYLFVCLDWIGLD